jgi:hypothetical protein
MIFSAPPDFGFGVLDLSARTVIEQVKTSKCLGKYFKRTNC